MRRQVAMLVAFAVLYSGQALAECQDAVYWRTVAEQYRSMLADQRVVTVTATAYSCQKRTRKTGAFNRLCRPGTVAVSRDLLDKGWAPGMQIYVPEIGVLRINDLLARHKRRTIDIFMGTEDEATRFGAKTIRAALMMAHH